MNNTKVKKKKARRMSKKKEIPLSIENISLLSELGICVPKQLEQV